MDIRTPALAAALALAAVPLPASATPPDNDTCAMTRHDGARLEWEWAADEPGGPAIAYRRDGVQYGTPGSYWTTATSTERYVLSPQAEPAWRIVVDRTTRDAAAPARLLHQGRVIATGRCGWDGSFVDEGVRR